ncbi:HlyD family secretion protein [Fundidesulfovibrio butyratiphilus]
MLNTLKKRVASADPSSGADAGKRRILLGGAALFFVLLAGYWFYTHGKVETDDAFVDGHSHTITPRVAGYVTNVAVEDNQQVKKGDLLVELDPTDLTVALAQARADLASAQAQLAALELGVPLEVSQTSSRVDSAQAQLESQLRSLEQVRKQEDAAREDVVRAKAQFDQAELDLARYKALGAKSVIAQSDLDNARTRQKTARADAQAAKAKLAGLGHQREAVLAEVDRLKAEIRLARTGMDNAVIKEKQAQAQRALVTLAEQRVRQAELNLSYTRILAPADGRVTKRRVEAGLMAAAGQPLMAVVPLDPGELWITANYKETQLHGVKPGQRAEVRVDAYPGRTFTGRVDSIMAGTGAAFSLFPPENATGNYVKVVQRVPVKIVLDPGQDIPELRLGMSAIPVIFTR